MTGLVHRAVVVGSGSAGYRHASELRRRLPDCTIVVVRRRASIQPTDRLLSVGVEIVNDVAEAASLRPDIAVVAGPASTHVRDTAHFGSAKAILVEKPLAVTAREAASIRELKPPGIDNIVVGYHLRCGETVPKFAELIRSGVVGRPRSFAFSVGQHLSQWRPGVDPSRSVTARVELGGGVLLELSHEIDGVRFVLGDVNSCTATLRYDGAPTDGSVETVADLELRLTSGVTGQVHLDMTNERPFRTWTVTGSEGVLDADLLSGTITRSSVGNSAEGREVLHQSADAERGLAEARLIENLLAVAAGESSPICNIEDGIAALRIIDAARTSDQRNNRPVNIGADATKH